MGRAHRASWDQVTASLEDRLGSADASIRQTHAPGRFIGAELPMALRNYHAYVPDLPGYIATGKTPDEVKPRMHRPGDIATVAEEAFEVEKK
jgi:hypothetical protein